MYFRRYRKQVLEAAISLEKITTQQFNKILDFWENDIMCVPSDTVDALGKRIQLDILKQQDDKNYIKILKWPYCKKMCLRFAPLEPWKWKYFDETDNELFEYDIHAETIAFP